MFASGDRVEFKRKARRGEDEPRIQKFTVLRVYKHHVLCITRDKKYKESFRPEELRRG